MSFVLLGILNSQAAAAGIEYFLNVTGDTDFDRAQGIALNSSNKLFLAGDTGSAGAGSFDFLLVGYNDVVEPDLQVTLGGGSYDSCYDIQIDSSDNIYLAGRTDSAGAGSADQILAKYNSVGVVQWQRVLGNSRNGEAYAIATDSLDNIYTIGDFEISTGPGQFNIRILLAKYNSSGTIQWQRTLGSGSIGDFTQPGAGKSIAFDSSDNLYIVGNTDEQGLGTRPTILAKYNSSGTIQWQRTLGDTGVHFAEAVGVDSSDNVYIAGRQDSQGQGSYDIFLAKYNSAGALQWQRILGGDQGDWAYAIAFDSSDNVYIAGYFTSNVTFQENGIIIKYNSSGTIQWQRLIGHAADDDEFYALVVDGNDDIYLAGRTDSAGAGSADIFLAKLPNDGSLTGTYSLDGVNFDYLASSLTAATSTFTSQTSTVSDSAGTATAASASLTSGSATLTSVTTEIG